jgi:tetratricopeptide (TPR) repeat protein
MSPQVAMASVLLLMVGIGLYALPLGQDTEPAGLRAAEDEGSPADLRAPASSATAAPTPAEAAEDREQERRDLPAVSERWRGETRAARPSRPAADARDLEAKGAPGTKAKAPRSAVRKPSGVADDGKDAVKAMGGAGAPAPAPAAKAERSRAASGSAEDYATGNRFAPPPPAAAAPVAEHAAGAPAEAKRRAAGESKAATSLSEGIAAARRGDVVQAEQQLAPIATHGDDKERAQASLWLARSLRSAGDCTRALTYYRKLTQAADAAPAILEEAADCYQRTGDSAQANRLRARVASPPTKTSH